MRISLALAAAALCFSSVGCTCPRCPYMGYPIPPRMAMLDAPGEFPDAPPAKPESMEQKDETSATAEKPAKPAKKPKSAPQVTTRSGVAPAKKQTGSAPAKTQVAAAKPPAVKPSAKQPAKTEVAEQGEKGASQLLATARPQPTVRTASSKPANYTPVSHGRRDAKPSPAANSGPALAAVIVVAPPKTPAKPATAVVKATPAVKAEGTSATMQHAAAPRLKQPGIVSGRGAKPRAEQPKQDEPRKPQLQAGETPAAGAKQVVHLETGA